MKNKNHWQEKNNLPLCNTITLFPEIDDGNCTTELDGINVFCWGNEVRFNWSVLLLIGKLSVVIFITELQNIFDAYVVDPKTLLQTGMVAFKILGFWICVIDDNCFGVSFVETTGGCDCGARKRWDGVAWKRE